VSHISYVRGSGWEEIGRPWWADYACRIGWHRWHRFLPSWGTFRWCGCGRVQRRVWGGREAWCESSQADMEAP
jgi:hypothetical protein